MKETQFPKFVFCSDNAFLVTLGDAISEKTHHKVVALYKALKQQLPSGVLTLTPAYCAVMVTYDPMVTGPGCLQPLVTALINAAPQNGSAIEGRVVEVPVCYGGIHGPDLLTVARHCDLSAEEVIARHSAVTYPIYMIGFSPGFPFLGGLDPKLHTPRLTTPRTCVPEGSVGIADAQTGIYPVESPGGWQIIGRTPLKLFRPDRIAPFRYQIGDRLRFVPVDPEVFSHILEKEAA